MIKALQRNFYRNGYLLIIAAWLYTISFIFSNYKSFVLSPSRVKSEVESYLKDAEERFSYFLNDSSFISAVLQQPQLARQSKKYFNNEVGLFLYVPDDQGVPALKFWSNNKALPDNKDIGKADGKYFSTYGNGDFEVAKKTILINDRYVLAFAVIPIRFNYFIKNKYLEEEYPAASGIESKYDLVRSDAAFYVRNGDGKALFGFKLKTRVDESLDIVSVTFRLLAIIFVAVFINVFAFDIANRKGWIRGFLFLTGTVFFIRLITYFLPFPFKFRNLELFDPSIYASNSLHPSLGDLLINVILVFWMVSYIKFAAINRLKKLRTITGNNAWIVTALLGAFLIALSFTAANIIRSLIVDSQISFDVINFNTLTVYSFLSFIILCFIILSFFHFSHLALLFINKCKGLPAYAKYLIIAVEGLIYLSLTVQHANAASNLIVLIWLMIYVLIMEYRKEDIYLPVLRSSFFLLWLIFFAASISALIIFQNHYKEIEQGRRLAENLARNADPEAETSMNIAVAELKDQFFTANSNRFNFETSNRHLKDSLLKQNFSPILNKYDTRLYTYDRFYRPLYNDDSASYDVIAGLLRRSKRAISGDIYYYENNLNGISFLYPKEVIDPSGNVSEYFFVVAESKKYKLHALYPELFSNVDDPADDYDITYAVYNKGDLINSFGEYAFPGRISKDKWLKQEFKEIKKDDNIEYWYNAGFNKLVILVKKGSLFFESITLFAYLFGSFLFIVVLFRSGQFLIAHKFSWKRIRQGFNLNIRYQIQSAIIFISIFSFIVIGFSTILFYIDRFNKNNRDRLVRAIKELSVEVEAEVSGQNTTASSNSATDISSKNSLEKNIKRIAEIHNVEVNLYDIRGNLSATSQPYIYEKKILAPVMNPIALHRLHFDNTTQVIQDEKISNFKYASIYSPVRLSQNSNYAYLNIPSLNSQKELNEEISNFLVTLINLNAFIFVIAGAISVFLTSRITSSFSLIAEKMRDIHLGKANEEIKWKRNDEIGALVNEYNKMVHKLEDSARALAKSEREGAWREMARQVAHEIKNPLTPMKLSIQHLQRAIQENNPKVVEMSQRVSATLVEQIDQLAKIASDFSQFANITKTTNEVFDVTDIINSLIDLYSSNQKLRIIYNHPSTPAIINADKTQINRLFTNLFQNAVEASEGNDIIPIIINREIKENEFLIHFTDEGCGIPVEKQSKIFTPNFTTKSSGTGLGLAMSKGIVEGAGGKIWFDTEENKGTTFHVLLPLAETTEG